MEDTVQAYIDNSSVSSAGATTVSSSDSPTIQTVAGAVSVAVATGFIGGAGASVGVSVAINDVQDNVWAYINKSTASATGGDVTVTATETATIDAWTIGGAVGVGSSGGADGLGLGAAGAGSGNTVMNHVYAYIQGNSNVTTNSHGDVVLMANDTSSIEAIAGGLGVGVGVGAGAGTGASLGAAAANNDIENTVKAYVDGSVVNSAGSVALERHRKRDHHDSDRRRGRRGRRRADSRAPGWRSPAPIRATASRTTLMPMSRARAW